jgi:hypothetical protein
VVKTRFLVVKLGQDDQIMGFQGPEEATDQVSVGFYNLEAGFGEVREKILESPAAKVHPAHHAQGFAPALDYARGVG